MPRPLLLLPLTLSLLALAVPARAQVYKCRTAQGGVEYSGTPCPAGAAGGVADVRPNTLDSAGLREQAARLGATRPAGVASGASAPGAATAAGPERVCPGETELRNLETSAGASTRDARQRGWLQDEVRRVRQCRAGEGRYTAQDWRELARAWADFDRIKPEDQAAAHARAEDLHAAANPLEAQRIAARRAADAAASAAEAARALRCSTLPRPAGCS